VNRSNSNPSVVAVEYLSRLFIKSFKGNSAENLHISHNNFSIAQPESYSPYLQGLYMTLALVPRDGIDIYYPVYCKLYYNIASFSKTINFPCLTHKEV
jgi:hypothetical protein